MVGRTPWSSASGACPRQEYYPAGRVTLTGCPIAPLFA
jgi:hypothetical protein